VATAALAYDGYVGFLYISGDIQGVTAASVVKGGDSDDGYINSGTAAVDLTRAAAIDLTRAAEEDLTRAAAVDQQVRRRLI
jgi:hypothetical protein